MRMKIMTIGGVIGSFCISQLGGWDIHLNILLSFILLDYLTGFIVAAIFKKSPKTITGTLNSTIGFIGLCKKLMLLIMIIIATKLDILLNIDLIRNGTIIAFIINELLSLIENAGLMGVSIPNIIRDSIDLLKKGDKLD